MAGAPPSSDQALSLRCNICGHQLKSADEAQQHAELTGHADFSESTEPVLNLVCRECGKPCRSQTEVDLHTKRTSHAQFEDRTMENASVVDVEAEKAAAEARGSSGSAESKDGAGGETDMEVDEAELVVPTVDEALKTELEEMGFSAARSIRAIHFSGGTGVEAAVQWILEHEEDPDIDTMPMVSEKAKSRGGKVLTEAEARVKAEELRLRAKKKREEEEKRLEREREKERIRMGKELLLAKQLEDDAERKRIIALRKAEKEEEQRAREKIKARIAEDKAERRRRLGLPPDEPKVDSQAEAEAKPSPSPPAPLPVRPASKAEKMRSYLRSMKQSHKDEEAKVKRAFQTLLTYVTNAATKDDDKFRRIRLSNAAFQDRVGCFQEAIEFLEVCGFQRGLEEDALILPAGSVDSVLLSAAASELNSAIVNPFFGAL